MPTRRILVVDDSDVDREAYRRYLASDREAIYAFEEAATGDLGLALARRGGVDCLLLDYRLPDMEAPQFLDELTLGGAAPMGIVVLTGQGNETMAVEVMKAGAHDYLPKRSLSSESLSRSIRHAIEKVALLDNLNRQRRELEATNDALSSEIDQRRRAERDLQDLAAGLERIVGERTKELVRTNKLKDEFLAAVSHELRTPLNAIVGWAQMARRANATADVRAKALETIDRNARIQTRLIDDLIDWSRIAAGQLRIESGPVDLVNVIASAVDALAPLAASRAIEIETSLPASAVGLGDSDRLRQAVWNLLSNAIKFTVGPGHVSVDLRPDGDMHVVTVTDSGVGIPPAFLPNVFEPFRQADSAPTRRHGGLGLGLALTRQILELHGGRVQAFSDGEGRGATFALFVPSAPLGVLEARERAEIDQAAPLLAGRRIVVADDDADARDLFERILVSVGAVVTTHSGAADAFTALAEHPPDLVISDIAMPGEDGFSLLRRVRTSDDPRIRQTPMVAVTAFSGPAEREDALRAGFNDHVGKPVLSETLIAAILRAFRTRPADPHPASEH